jgi:pimeloyl-ACP methyl ester carboxylesterase
MRFFCGFIFLVGLLATSHFSHAQNAIVKPTICILGGTPSSAKVIDEIPDELKTRYNFISFNRPGFGGSSNAVLDKKKLFELARQAGLKDHDYAVIGISGGGPLAILIAHEFKLRHCGVISGMVPEKEYFAYADSAFTKPLMRSVLNGYDDFKKTVESFPNGEEILKQADSPVPMAIRACFDDLNFILSDNNFNRKIFEQTMVTWWHGAHDRNVTAKSAQLFITKFKHADFKLIPNESHAIDARVYVKKLLSQWGDSVD